MKVKTVGVVAAMGMMLTSLTVWSLTAPKAPVGTLGPEGPLTVATGEPVANDAIASFTAGRTLMVEGRLGHQRMLAGESGKTFLFLDVTADRDATAQSGAGLNLAIVIDRSGSMKGKRLDNALDAARGMVRRLRDGDVVSVVTYNTRAETVAAPTTVDAFSRDRVLRALDGVTAQGDTCISCGIDAGMAELRARNGMVDRLLLLSDGEATAGVRDLEGFRAIGARARNMGVSISSVGVDVEYNERVMSALALESNGRHHFVENASALARVFDQELDTLVKTLAQDTEVEVALAPGVNVERVFDRSFRRQGDKLIVPMGGFSAGEQKTLLVELQIPRGAPGVRPVADVHLSYRDLALGSPGSCDGKLALHLVEDPSQVSSLDPFVAGRVQRSQTAATLSEANQLFAAGRADEAKKKLEDRLSRLERERSAAVAATPAPKQAALDGDFAAQAEALDEASEGFAAPPAGAAPSPAAKRKGDVTVKKSQAKATELAF